MENDRLDCGWCGSARSIEYGLCQVCLMEYPMETQIIQLPLDRSAARGAAPRTVRIDQTEAVAEQ